MEVVAAAAWTMMGWPSAPTSPKDRLGGAGQTGSRFGHSVRRPGQFVCPNSDKIYLTIVTFRFLLLFFAY